VIIEGGNVILGKNEVFLGVGDRTSRNSVEWLASEVGPQWTVTPIYLKPGVLHLDCAFCPIEGNGAGSSAIVYEGAFERNEDLQLIKERYGKIWSVKQEDYDTLAPNVLKLDKKTVIVNSSHENIAKLFREHHYEVIEHDYSEIIKGGGSYRCTFGPFHRED
jgi:N-dimethylarginine dimethylaminohydrolase